MSDADYLRLEGLTIRYGDVVAVNSLDMSVPKGEFIALLGPSGCGKTTTMRAIAGLLEPSAGRIRLDGADITRTPANRREVGLVFQSYALFPHLTVFENVAFGQRLKGLRGEALERKVARGLSAVGLESFGSRRIAQLSGGQQQRVALARSLVMAPKLLMLDEPLSNLDARLRLEMRAQLQRIHKETGVTIVFVTHDQAEALAIADRIVVMRAGVIEQVGAPEQIYNAPVSAFVADFVGFETIFPLEEGKLRTPGGSVPLAGAVEGGVVALAWRPDGVKLGEGAFSGIVRGVSFAGATRQYLLETPMGPIKADASASLAPRALGETVAFDLPLAAAATLTKA